MLIPLTKKIEVLDDGRIFYRAEDKSGVLVKPEAALAHVNEQRERGLLGDVDHARIVQRIQAVQSGAGVGAIQSKFEPAGAARTPAANASVKDVLTSAQGEAARGLEILRSRQGAVGEGGAGIAALRERHRALRQSVAPVLGEPPMPELKTIAPARDAAASSSSAATQPPEEPKPIPKSSSPNAKRAILHVIEAREGLSIKDLKDQPAATKWLGGKLSKILHHKTRPSDPLMLAAALVGPDGVGRKLTAEIYARMLFDNGVITAPNVYVIDVRRCIESRCKLDDYVLQVPNGVILLENADILDRNVHHAELNLIEGLAVAKGEPALLVSGAPSLRATLDMDYRTRDTLRTQIVYKPLTPDTLADIFVTHAKTRGYEVDESGKKAARGRLRSLHNAGGDDVAMLFEESVDRLAENLYENGEQPDVPPSAEKSSTLTGADVARPTFFDKNGSLPVLDRLEKRTGQEQFKKWARAFADRILENQRSRALGEEVEPSNTNIMMFGEKGTGKTSALEFVNDLLYETGERNGKMTYVTAGELIGSTEAESFERVADLFKRGKFGLIAIDEAHILAKTPEGRAVLRALVPFALNESGTTTLALLGYPGPLMDCLDPDIDEGTARRFPDANRVTLDVPTREQLRTALIDNIEKRKYTYDDDLIEFAMSMVDKAKTKSGFGNFGTIKDMVDAAITRLASRKRTPDTMRKLIREDFGPPPDTIIGVASRLDVYVGFEHLRDAVIKIGEAVDENRKAKKPVRDAYQPYARIIGDIGTGRKEFTKELTRIYESFDLVSDPTANMIDVTTLRGGVVGEAGKLTNQAVRRVASSGGHAVLYNIGGLFKKEHNEWKFLDQYAEDVAKNFTSLLTKERNNIAVSLVATEEELDIFFKLTPALKSLFSRRFDLKRMDGDAAAKVLEKKLAALDFTLHDEATGILPQIMAHVVTQPDWQNGLDIEALAMRVRDEHLSVRRKAEYADRDRASVSAEALITAVDELLRDKGGVPWSERDEKQAPIPLTKSRVQQPQRRSSAKGG